MGNVFGNIVDAGARAGSRGAQFISYLADTEWAQRQNKKAEQEDQLRQQTIDAGKQLQQLRANQEARAQAGEAREQEKWNIIKPAAEAQSNLTKILNDSRADQELFNRADNQIFMKEVNDPNSPLFGLPDAQQQDVRKTQQWKAKVQATALNTLYASGDVKGFKDVAQRAGYIFKTDKDGNETVTYHGKTIPFNRETAGNLLQKVENNWQAEMAARDRYNPAYPGSPLQIMARYYVSKTSPAFNGSYSDTEKAFMGYLSTLSRSELNTASIHQTLQQGISEISSSGKLSQETIMNMQRLSAKDPRTGLSGINQLGYEFDPQSMIFTSLKKDEKGQPEEVLDANQMNKKLESIDTASKGMKSLHEGIMAKYKYRKMMAEQKMISAQSDAMVKRAAAEKMFGMGESVQENGVSEEGKSVYVQAIQNGKSPIKNQVQAEDAVKNIQYAFQQGYRQGGFDRGVQDAEEVCKAYGIPLSAVFDQDTIDEMRLKDKYEGLKKRLIGLQKEDAEQRKKNKHYGFSDYQSVPNLSSAPGLAKMKSEEDVNRGEREAIATQMAQLDEDKRSHEENKKKMAESSEAAQKLISDLRTARAKQKGKKTADGKKTDKKTDKKK